MKHCSNLCFHFRTPCFKSNSIITWDDISLLPVPDEFWAVCVKVIIIIIARDNFPSKHKSINYTYRTKLTTSWLIWCPCPILAWAKQMFPPQIYNCHTGLNHTANKVDASAALDGQSLFLETFSTRYYHFLFWRQDSNKHTPFCVTLNNSNICVKWSTTLELCKSY